MSVLLIAAAFTVTAVDLVTEIPDGPLQIAVAAVVLGLVLELVKRTVDAWATRRGAVPLDPDQWVPPTVIVLGVTAGLFGVVAGGWLGGLVAALSAAGAVRATKTAIGTVTDVREERARANDTESANPRLRD